MAEGSEAAGYLDEGGGGKRIKKVCVVTGTRAEYGLLKPVMRAVENHPSLELQVVATGMHLMPEFGMTYREIERDGFRIEGKVEMILGGDTKKAMAKSVGVGILGLSEVMDTLAPDVVVVLGDRVEALAGALSAVYMGIPLAHIHGGDSARAGMDEYARHAITKLAHLHFVATEKSAERIVKMGEEREKVFVVGAPGLDTILHTPLLSREEACERAGLDPGQPYLLVVQHPVSTDPHRAGEEMRITLEALDEVGVQFVLIYPNADAGGAAMIEVIKEYRNRYASGSEGGHPLMRAYESLEHTLYLSLLKHASAMVGNSSSGIIEAPSLGVPVVNIGTRQEGRERGDNVLDVPPVKESIVEAVRRALEDEEFIRKAGNTVNPYGDGHAGERIARILADVEITPELLRKKLTY
ncbi:MAG: UDP-N-acetylglucosamine 2-epimerase (hydrolyzing) [Thermoplasmata archaeon]|nr:UDP-N-acetylglucosamine 2-epimerase (hydrolyzing) [Thermoplasmata archaeon]